MAAFHKIEEALEDLKKGKIILVTDDAERENEGDFICAAQFATTENINFMATYGCRTDFADIQNKKECGGNRQWQNHYLRNWAANTKGKGIIYSSANILDLHFDISTLKTA